ncbi:MAG: hypothetical protein MAG715_00254 [Methanonatronarchaeales archaeon]|nr:hypothetical protein [Methanonatronarchaeales archaeon]
MVRVPIDIEVFDKSSDEDLRRRGTNAEIILSLLMEHPEKAFTPGEIAEETSVARNSVGPVLARLEDRNLVRHKGKYWALGNDLDTLASTLATSEAMTERFGPENPEEWK